MRTSIFFFVFLLCFLPEILLAQAKRIALVIGNNNYEYATKLENPVNDANSVSENLKILGFEVFPYNNLDQKGMKQAIDLFGEKLKSAETGLFYYSGHGIQLNGFNYLIPVDANLGSEDDAEYDCVDAGRILSKMESSGTKTNIIILDACRNNPFEKSWNRSYKKSGLAFMDAPTGSLIAYSTSPGNTASDGDGKNGLYTSFLLNAMLNPDLNILQVFQEVRKNVREKSSGSQVPWESTSLENDFYFNQTGKVLTRTDVADKASTKNPDEREIRSKIENIKSDTSLVWYEATAKDLVEADKLALTEFNKLFYSYLKQKVNLNPNQTELSPDTEKGLQLLIDEFGSTVLRKVSEEKKGFRVIRYLSRREVNYNLDLKKNRILTMIEDADVAEESLRIGDALKYYYWAYTLGNVFPGQIRGSAGDKSFLSSGLYLEQHIPELVNSIGFYASDSTVNDVSKSFKIQFHIKDRPVQNISFRYWNGVSWSDVVYANNGSSVIDIYPSYSIRDVKIGIEYSNLYESKFDNYLNRSLQLTFDDPFRNEKALGFRKPDVIMNATATEDLKQIVNNVLQHLQKKDIKYDSTLFTREGFDVYKKLLIYGNASMLNIDDSFSSYQMEDKTFIRNIPCTFGFQNNKVKFSENLCFELNNDGRIQNISFALSNKAVQDIMAQERWPLMSRLQIIHFMENYKTAYALKRYDYIEKIFSDNALIIVGQKVEEASQTDGSKYVLSGNNYEFTKLTKEQYLYRLRNVFSKNEYINIRFEENVVKKRDNESNVYGINIRQNYFSSNYADQGYLFLMIDMKDTTRPMIYVRSWQPLETFNGHAINLSDFTY